MNHVGNPWIDLNLRDRQKMHRYSNTKSLPTKKKKPEKTKQTNKQKKNQNPTNQKKPKKKGKTKNHHHQQNQTTFSSTFSVIMNLLVYSVQSLQGYRTPESTAFLKLVFVKVELQPFKNKQTNK